MPRAACGSRSSFRCRRRTELFLPDAAATEQAGAALAPLLRTGDVVTLSGALGAGKTSFARGLLAALGLKDDAPSPTFAIVIAYAPPEVTLPVWHVDLYRLADPEEAYELGLDDARDAAALLIEWPEQGAVHWSEALALRFEVMGEGRRLTWEAGPAWAERWPPPPLLQRSP